jgi:hypothetical protein
VTENVRLSTDLFVTKPSENLLFQSPKNDLKLFRKPSTSHDSNNIMIKGNNNST